LQSLNPMREQVIATAGALLSGFDALELSARLALETPDIYRTRRIVLTGSGDSWFAAKAAEVAFWFDGQLAAEVRTPIETGRYQSQLSPRSETENTLLIAVSSSGAAVRVLEAATLWRSAGAKVLGVTRNEAGRLAGLADRTLILPVPDLPNAPGFGPYLFTLLGLLLLAIRLGEVKMTITMDEAQALRGRLKRHIGELESIISALDEPTHVVAKSLVGKTLVEFVGAGPSYAVAEYGAAKLLEASGRHALARDLEEWAHLNYFDHAPSEIATVLVVPQGSVAQSRAVELIGYMHKLGRSLVVAGGGEASDKAKSLGHATLPVPALDERWSPLFLSVVPALIAAHLSALDGAEYGRGGKPPWDDSSTAATVQQSAIWGPGK
jgi:glutamine---fructose-6-phosphate transaminase (isomerizing)